MRRFLLAVFFLVLLPGVAVQTARADQITIFSVNATSPDSPGRSLTGIFTLDQTTGTVVAWNLLSTFGIDTFVTPAGLPYNNGTGQVGLPPYEDSAALSTGTGTFGIEFVREFNIPDPSAGKLLVEFDLDLEFAGSPETFSGGPILSGSEVGSLYYGLDTLVGRMDGAATMYTPEPSSMVLLGAGLLALAGLAVKIRQ